MQIVNCKHRSLIPRSSLRAPRFARCGLSLTEVLIAMGILTLGLLGVASIFPVASFYMHKADLNDRGSAIARSVMNDIVTRGMLKPGAWFTLVPTPITPASGQWNTRFPGDGKYCTLPAADPRVPGTVTRPFQETLTDALRQPAATPGNPQYDPTLIGRQFGSAFVIDPLGTAAMAARNHNNVQRNMIARPFPASVYFLANMSGPAGFYNAAWAPWGNSGNTWPIRRVTFQQSDGWPMDERTSEHYFQSSDDLSTDLPDRDDRPAEQNWDTLADSNGVERPMVRQWAGDYSWIVTVLPTTSAARDGLARNPSSFAYDVSVVVFYKRPLPTAPPISTAELPATAAPERAVKARIVSTGLNGGELLLERLPPNMESITEDPFRQLRSGQWIMLCGPHPNSNNSDPRFVLKWYQVLTIDTEGSDPRFDPATQRLVTVRGPQWPWHPSQSPSGVHDSNHLSNNLCAGIFRGAVAVHTKTVHFENLRGGSWGSGMAVVVPPGVDPPRYGFN